MISEVNDGSHDSQIEPIIEELQMDPEPTPNEKKLEPSQLKATHELQLDPKPQPHPLEPPKELEPTEPKATEELKFDPKPQPVEPKLEPKKPEPTKKSEAKEPINNGSGASLEAPPPPLEGEGGQPKKKRKLLKDMTPNSKEAELVRRREANKEKSKLWHQKWASKGVPKSAGDDQGEASNVELAALPAGDDGGDAKDVNLPEGDHDSKAKDDFKPSQELMDMAVDGDMRKVRSKFLCQWHEWHASESEPGKAKKEAEKAWLESELRAQILAGRKGKVY